MKNKLFLSLLVLFLIASCNNGFESHVNEVEEDTYFIEFSESDFVIRDLNGSVVSDPEITNIIYENLDLYKSREVKSFSIESESITRGCSPHSFRLSSSRKSSKHTFYEKDSSGNTIATYTCQRYSDKYTCSECATKKYVTSHSVCNSNRY